MPLPDLLRDPILIQSRPRFHRCVQNRRETAGAADSRRRGVRNREVCECLRELHKVSALVLRRRALPLDDTVDIARRVSTE